MKVTNRTGTLVKVAKQTKLVVIQVRMLVLALGGLGHSGNSVRWPSASTERRGVCRYPQLAGRGIIHEQPLRLFKRLIALIPRKASTTFIKV